MTFSIEAIGVLLGLMIVALAIFTWPFWGRVRQNNKSDTIDLYKKQLAELESDLVDELISQQDYDIARAEVGRRLLRASKEVAPESSKETSPLLVGVMTVVLITASLFGYLSIGRPDLQGSPTQSRVDAAKEQMITGPDGTPQKVDDVLKQLDEVLSKKPNDIEGWTIMARTAGQMGDAPRMARAYGNLARLEPDNADWLAMQGEALVRISNGMVAPPARHVFLKAVQLNPKHPLPRYYMGLAASQDGDHERALEIWEDLEADSEADAPWMQTLVRQIASTKATINGDAESSSGPTAAQQEAVQNMSPEDQKAFINQMVAGLRERLAENPNDLEGWLRLARAEQVLDNKAGEITALKKVLELVKDVPDSTEITQLRAQIEARLGEIQ